MTITILTQTEVDLMAGDELIRVIEASTGRVSEASRKQMISEIRTLQKFHKRFCAIKVKTLVVTGVTAFLMGVVFLKIGESVDYRSADSFVSGYQADADSYQYREHQRISKQEGEYVGMGLLLLFAPFFQAGVYLFLRSRSRMYKLRLKELESVFLKSA